MKLEELFEENYPVTIFDFNEKEQFAIKELEEYIKPDSKYTKTAVESVFSQTYIKDYIATTLDALGKLSSEYVNLLEIEEEHRKENGKLREEVKMYKESSDFNFEQYQDIGKTYFDLKEKIEDYINNATCWSESDYEYTLVNKTQIGMDILKLLKENK